MPAGRRGSPTITSLGTQAEPPARPRTPASAAQPPALGVPCRATAKTPSHSPHRANLPGTPAASSNPKPWETRFVFSALVLLKERQPLSHRSKLRGALPPLRLFLSQRKAQDTGLRRDLFDKLAELRQVCSHALSQGASPPLPRGARKHFPFHRGEREGREERAPPHAPFCLRSEGLPVLRQLSWNEGKRKAALAEHGRAATPERRRWGPKG